MRWVESVGRTIRRHRKSKAVRLAHLERAVRISVETLSAVEHDETILSSTEFSSLCLFLELDSRRLQAIETLATKLLERHVFAPDATPAAGEPFAVDRVARIPRSFEEINAVAAYWRRTLPVPPHRPDRGSRLFRAAG
jgi:transcriptional regulator with XRE-family HTH domain